MKASKAPAASQTATLPLLLIDAPETAANEMRDQKPSMICVKMVRDFLEMGVWLTEPASVQGRPQYPALRCPAAAVILDTHCGPPLKSRPQGYLTRGQAAPDLPAVPAIVDYRF